MVHQILDVIHDRDPVALFPEDAFPARAILLFKRHVKCGDQFLIVLASAVIVSKTTVGRQLRSTHDFAELFPDEALTEKHAASYPFIVSTSINIDQRVSSL